MKHTLTKYPPEAVEVCEYDVISQKRWNTITNRKVRETYRPAAGPYFDGDGWMLNAALAGYRNCTVCLVETPWHDGKTGITIYRATRELVEVEGEE